MAIVNMPIYRQLFDFLSLASIAISIAKTERERRRSPKHAKPSEHSSYHQQGGAKFKSLEGWGDMSGSSQGAERSGGTGKNGDQFILEEWDRLETAANILCG